MGCKSTLCTFKPKMKLLYQNVEKTVALYLSCLYIQPLSHISSESASLIIPLHLISHHGWRQNAGASHSLTQQVAALPRGGSGASNIPGMCHSFWTAFGVTPEAHVGGASREGGQI